MRTAISGETFRLRRWRAADAPELLNLALESAAEIGPRMMWTDTVTDLAGAGNFIGERLRQWDDGEGYALVAERRDTGRLIGGGAVGHINRQHRVANLGYFVRTSETGRGLAAEIGRLLAAFAFGDLWIQRLEILIEPDNAASLRVAEKLGAVREGVLRHRLLIHGTPRDAVMFSLLPDSANSDRP